MLRQGRSKGEGGCGKQLSGTFECFPQSGMSYDSADCPLSRGQVDDSVLCSRPSSPGTHLSVPPDFVSSLFSPNRLWEVTVRLPVLAAVRIGDQKDS